MAREFTGTNVITVGTTPAAPAAATLVSIFWLPASFTTGYASFIHYGGSGTGYVTIYAIYVSGTLRPSFEQTRASGGCWFRSDSASAISTGTWYALAATYDESASPAAHIYLASFDGSNWSNFAELSYDQNSDGSGSTTATSGTWRIGRVLVDGTVGQRIALTARWSSVLTLTQLNAWKDGGFQLVGQGELAFWLKDANTLARDFSGNQRNGTITGTTVQSDPAGLAPTVLTPIITAANKLYDGTTSASTATRTFSQAAALTGFTVSLAAGSGATFADKNAGNGKTVSETGVSLTGADAGIFSLSSTTATGTADIKPRPLYVRLVPNSKNYDGGTNASGTLTLR